VSKEQKIRQALSRSKAVLDLIGLQSWSIGVNNSYSAVAKTQHDERRILFSKRYIIISTEEDFDRTTIHEATHALLGYGKGHGEEFIKLHNRLYPKRPFDGSCTSAPIQKYKLLCNNCGNYTTSNSNKEVCCSYCASDGSGVYNMEISKNVLGFKEWASIQ